ncbi:MAG: globin [Actinomycetota bacterium]|nr:globin [Actinomycetota bacterium]
MAESLYERLGERQAIFEIAHRFYAKVATDAVLLPLYPEQDLAGAEERLALFLVQYCGGPEEYQQRRGHPKLRLRHFEFAIGEAERAAWMSAMTQAVTETAPPPEAAAELIAALARTAGFLVNRGGLSLGTRGLPGA